MEQLRPACSEMAAATKSVPASPSASPCPPARALLQPRHSMKMSVRRPDGAEDDDAGEERRVPDSTPLRPKRLASGVAPLRSGVRLRSSSGRRWPPSATRLPACMPRTRREVAALARLDARHLGPRQRRHGCCALPPLLIPQRGDHGRRHRCSPRPWVCTSSRSSSDRGRRGNCSTPAGRAARRHRPPVIPCLPCVIA